MLDIAAHNLANVNTVAYKEKQASFAELPSRAMTERRLPVAGNPPTPRLSGRGVLLSSVTSSCEEAPLAFTGNNLDLAVAGEGYLRVIRPDGSYAFTRAGNFILDAEGNMVTAKGLRLDFSPGQENQREDIDFSTMKITCRGEIYASYLQEEDLSALPDGEEEKSYSGERLVKLGELSLYRFTNPQGLSYIGDNLVLPSAASGPPLEGKAGEAGFGEIKQGFLEGANVDIGRQMVTLIRGQRALQASARAAVAADELWALTLNVQV
jgi:flagellar basal-body rod protein FlgG